MESSCDLDSDRKNCEETAGHPHLPTSEQGSTPKTSKLTQRAQTSKKTEENMFKRLVISLNIIL